MQRIGIVNRGEPAVRFLTTLDALRRADDRALRGVALYTDADADAWWVQLADEAVRIGEGRGAYLDAAAVIDGLRAARCDAAWLGWGFASEDGDFAQALEDAGITLIAPRAETMRALGDKIRAKALAEQHAVPVAPWAVAADPAAAVAAARAVGFPLLIKAAGGGGGRGIRRVDRLEDIEAAFIAARDEAARSFGGEGVFIERLVTRARHVEVQVLGDGEGAVRVVGVRDCSLQRRRQKVVEECPAPGLDPAAIDAMCAAARRLCEAVRYRSAGTVEFLYDLDARRPCFLEVNTRLQVEHPVTEEVWGLDLVRAQIDVARGRGLPTLGGARGWAVEARICAEDAGRGFTPAPGRLVRLVLPAGPGIRVDSGFAEGDAISPEFDPLIAKLIAHGPDRATAFARLAQGLERTRIVVDGGATNLAFLRALVDQGAVKSGEVDTGLVERLSGHAPAGREVAALAAAIDRFVAAGDALDGPERHRVDVGAPARVYRLGPERFRVASDAGAVTVRRVELGPHALRLELGEARHRVERAPGDTRYLVDGVDHVVAAATGGALMAPSAALVLAVPVAPGDRVEAGDAIVILESMKMEVRVDAKTAGVVGEICVAPGEQITAGQRLATVERTGDADDARDDDALALPTRDDGPAGAVERVRAAFVGWDHDPRTALADARRVEARARVELLDAFADFAALFDGRPDRLDGPEGGAAEAVSPHVWLDTLAERGPDALPAAHRARLLAAAAHHRVGDLDALDPDTLRRLRRAGARLADLQPVAVALLDALDRPVARLLERLAELDPSRLGAVVDAAGRARYRLVDRPAHDRLLEQANTRARDLLARLQTGDADWDALAEAPESLVPAFAPRAVHDGCPVAAEAVARRLEWSPERPDCRRVEFGPRPGFVLTGDVEPVAVVTARPAELAAVLAAAPAHGPLRRLDVVLTPDADDPIARDGDALVAAARAARPAGDPGWRSLCLIVPRPGADGVIVRRLRADGTERADRRDVMPSSARRLDLDRLVHFDLERMPSPDDVVLFLARATDNPDDRRLLAYGEIRSLERGHGLHLPHVDRVFHAAVRAIEAARAVHDPRRRLQWNRITLRVVPPVPGAPERLRSYIERLAPHALGIGLEKVVVRARFQAGAEAPGPLLDIVIRQRASGEALHVEHHDASPRPLEPLTPHHAKIVRARQSGLVDPYEIIALLKNAPALPESTFTEYDLGPDGDAEPVGDREPGRNTAAVVFGVIESAGAPLPGAALPGAILPGPTARVLLLSDPTIRMGALAAPECDRIIAALDLAERRGLSVEWVAVSAGARIDWHSGTENLDATAAVLRRIVRFTQAGGQIDIIVPGICVGAQAYFNAEATMMTHTRGLLVMTERGSMVLTGKRALDASGCVSAADDLALGGYTEIMGPNGQAQAYARDLDAAYALLYRYHAITHVAPGARRPPRVETTDPLDRDVTASPYPEALGHGFTRVGELFSATHNPDRKRPFAVRPVMRALADADTDPVERWAALHEAESVVVWEARVGGYATTLIGVENRPIARLGQRAAHGPETFAGGTLYPQGARKLARALNAASGRRPVVVLANLSGFDGSPESLRRWQLEYGAEIGRAVVNFDGPIAFVVLSRYHGGAYVVFSKRLNPELTALALDGSYASVIGGAPAATVVFARDVRRRAAELAPDPRAQARATAELAARFDGIHTVERARDVGSIDALVAPTRLRPAVIDLLARDHARPSVRPAPAPAPRAARSPARPRHTS